VDNVYLDVIYWTIKRVEFEKQKRRVRLGVGTYIFISLLSYH